MASELGPQSLYVTSLTLRELQCGVLKHPLKCTSSSLMFIQIYLASSSSWAGTSLGAMSELVLIPNYCAFLLGYLSP